MKDRTQLEIERGGEAKRLLENPLFVEAFDKVEEGIIKSMKGSAFGDESTHNKLVIALQLLGSIKKNITEVVETGKMAEISANDGMVAKFRAAAGF